MSSMIVDSRIAVFVGFVDRVEERRLFDPGDLEKDVKFV